MAQRKQKPPSCPAGFLVSRRLAQHTVGLVETNHPADQSLLDCFGLARRVGCAADVAQSSGLNSPRQGSVGNLRHLARRSQAKRCHIHSADQQNDTQYNVQDRRENELPSDRFAHQTNSPLTY
jgi:hypothetical protein